MGHIPLVNPQIHDMSGGLAGGLTHHTTPALSAPAERDHCISEGSVIRKTRVGHQLLTRLLLLSATEEWLVGRGWEEDSKRFPTSRVDVKSRVPPLGLGEVSVEWDTGCVGVQLHLRASGEVVVSVFRQSPQVGRNAEGQSDCVGTRDQHLDLSPHPTAAQT